MGWARAGWLGMVGLVALGGLTPGATADMPAPPPPGQHYQSTSATVDLGAFHRAALRRHHVEEGDTLSALAQRLLGASKRWKEIRDWNPGIDPHRLRVGSELLIPPRVATVREEPLDENAPASRRETWLFGIAEYGGLDPTRALVEHRGPIPLSGSQRLMALRSDRAGPLLARVRAFEGTEPQTFPATLDARDRAAFGMTPDGLCEGQWVRDEDDAAHTVEVHYRLVDIRDGALVLEETSRVRRDHRGQVLTFAMADDETDGAALGRVARWDLVFVFLAMLALIGIGVVASRRRASRAPAETTLRS